MNTRPHIVFDLFGVIFHINKWEALKYLGLIRLAKFVIKTGKNPATECFSLLDTMRLKEPGEFQDLVAYETTYLPVTLCQWLKGQKTSEEVIEKFYNFLNKLDAQNYFKTKEHKEVIERLMGIIVKPAVFDKLIYASTGMTIFLQKLVKNGYQCYVLSNIDTQTHTLIQEKFPAIFKLFSGQIVSWQVELLKPQKEIFLKVKTMLGVPLESCYYLDDQPENIKMANEVGMKGIFFSDEKMIIKKLKKELKIY